MEQEHEAKRYLFKYSYKRNPVECGNDPGRCIVDADGIEGALEKFYSVTEKERKFVVRIWNIEILGNGRHPL